jgi:hypothetical protein
MDYMRSAALLLVAAILAGAQTGEWRSMFDGKSMDGWKETNFTRKGKVSVENGTLVLGAGAMTGVNYTKAFPRTNYELRYEAARMDGDDFFASVTFPVGDAVCSWIAGGWSGSVVGLSSLDGLNAAENETTAYKEFKKGQWYKFRLRVTDWWIQAWIDDELIIQVGLDGRRVTVREGSEIELSAPIGFASYSTTGAMRNLEFRELPQEAPAK